MDSDRPVFQRVAAPVIVSLLVLAGGALVMFPTAVSDAAVPVTPVAHGTAASTPVSAAVPAQAGYYIYATESGLPCSDSWTIRISYVVSSTTGSCTLGTFPVTFSDGTYPWWGYYVGHLVPDPAKGTVTVNGADANFSLQYVQGYLANFTETGLPSSEYWDINVTVTADQLSLDQYSTLGNPSIDLYVPNGTVAFRVDPPAGWSAIPSQGTFDIAGSGTHESIRFFQPQYSITFAERGLPVGTTWSVAMNGVNHSSSYSSILFTVPNGTYAFNVSPVAGFETTYRGQIVVSGTPVTTNVTFVQTTYIVTFQERGLPSGDHWSVTVNGSIRTAFATGALTFTEPNGTVAYTVSPVAGYTTAFHGEVTVQGRTVSEIVTFSQVNYTVTFSESGLPPGTSWSVTLDTSTQSSLTSTIDFTAPNGSFSFTVRSTSGYSANITSGFLHVNGEPVNRTLSFANPNSSPGPNATPSAGGFLGLPGEIGYLLVGGIAALIAAIVALLVRNRSRDRGPGTVMDGSE